MAADDENVFTPNDNEVRPCYGCKGPFSLCCWRTNGLPPSVCVYILFEFFSSSSHFTIQDSRLRFLQWASPEESESHSNQDKAQIHHLSSANGFILRGLYRFYVA